MTTRILRLAALFALVLTAQNGPWPVEKLYTRPFVWGTSPERLAWSKLGHTLVFLWNAEGRRFLDLYAYHPDTQKLARLTDLESLKDDLNLSAEEKDERQKRHLMPPAGIDSFEISRDGSRVVFSYKGDVYLALTDGSRPAQRLMRTKGGESSPQLSPDNKRLAYSRDGQIYVQDLDGARLTQITDIEGGRLGAFRWSPDAKQFAYTVSQGSARSMVLPNYSGRFVTARTIPRNVAGDEPLETSRFVVPADGGKPVALEGGSFGGKVYATAPEWSPDSTRLLLRVVEPRMKKLQLLVVDAKTGKAKAVVEEQDDKWVFWSHAAWSPDGQEVLFTSERDGFAHIYTVAAAGGTPKQVTRGNWETRAESFTFEPKWIGDSIYFGSTEVSPSERHLYRIKPDGSGKERLSRREGLNGGLVSEDGKHIAWMLADLDNPLDLWVGERQVTRSPRPEFYRYPWPKTQFVSFPSRGDKKTVSAKILLPPGYRLEDRGQKQWPVVFFIHGAGYATSVLKQWGSYAEVRYVFNAHLANQGYVIMDLDYRGSSGYGREWRRDVYLHLGGPELQDVLGAVDYLGGLGNIDMKRIGLWGVSYGGFMTNMAMFQAPDVFRAGSAWAAVNDWENYNAFYTTQRLNSPRESIEAYRRSSPIHFSGMLKNKLLMLHGMVDRNVLFQEAVQLSEKLIQEGKDFSHFYYPEEDHAFIRDETLIDACRRTSEWFDRHLK